MVNNYTLTRVSEVNDYADTFAIENLRENEKVCETVFACPYTRRAQVESFKQKKSVKSLVTQSL